MHDTITGPVFQEMLIFGAAVGLINGTLVSRMKIPSFIVTLCAQSVYRAMAIIISNGCSKPPTPRSRRASRIIPYSSRIVGKKRNMTETGTENFLEM